MLQSQLCNDLGRAGETESTGVERYVIEGRIVNLGVEITPDVPASRMVFLPDKFGRFGFIQVVFSNDYSNSKPRTGPLQLLANLLRRLYNSARRTGA